MSGQTCALIGADNVVFNIIVIDGDFAAEGVTAVKSSVAQIGDTYEPLNGEFSRPAPPDTQELRAQMPELTPRQFRDALIDADIMPDQVTAAIKLIPDAKQQAKALNAWEYPTRFTRIDPLLDQIGAMFELTPEQIDTLWMGAASNG